MQHILDYPTDYFSASQCICMSVGNITHVYISLKSSKDIPAGTTHILTGHPIVPILQRCGAISGGENIFIVQINSEKIEINHSFDIKAETWVRFSFSYISAK